MTKICKRGMILLLTLLLLFAAGCGSGSGAGSSESVFAAAKEGDTLGDFSAPLLSGETFTLSEHSGKVVLINFWATWCGYCVAEFPDFQKLHETYGDDLVLLAIDSAEDQKTVQSFIDENGYTFSIALDPDRSLSGFLSGIPYTVLLDQNGKVAYTHSGGGDGMFALYSAKIDELL